MRKPVGRPLDLTGGKCDLNTIPLPRLDTVVRLTEHIIPDDKTQVEIPLIPGRSDLSGNVSAPPVTRRRSDDRLQAGNGIQLDLPPRLIGTPGQTGYCKCRERHLRHRAPTVPPENGDLRLACPQRIPVEIAPGEYEFTRVSRGELEIPRHPGFRYAGKTQGDLSGKVSASRLMKPQTPGTPSLLRHNRDNLFQPYRRHNTNPGTQRVPETPG